MACLVVRDPDLALWRRDEESLGERPLALARSEGPTAQIMAADERAVRAGVRTGQTMAQARSLCPLLAVRPARPEAVAGAIEALEADLTTLTPHVGTVLDARVAQVASRASRASRASQVRAAVTSEDGHAGTGTRTGTKAGGITCDAARGPCAGSRRSSLVRAEVREGKRTGPTGRQGAPCSATVTLVLGVTGIEGRWRGPREFLAAAMACAREHGLPARGACARRVFAARMAALHGPEDATIVPAAQESALLAGLPLEALAAQVADGVTRRALVQAWQALGLQTIGDLMALDRRAMTDRYGKEGLALWELARGDRDDAVVPIARRPLREHTVRFEEPTLECDAILRAIAPIVARMTETARQGDVPLAALELTLVREACPDGVSSALRVAVPDGSCDHALWMALLRCRLEALMRPDAVALQAVSHAGATGVRALTQPVALEAPHSATDPERDAPPDAHAPAIRSPAQGFEPVPGIRAAMLRFEPVSRRTATGAHTKGDGFQAGVGTGKAVRGPAGTASPALAAAELARALGPERVFVAEVVPSARPEACWRRKTSALFGLAGCADGAGGFSTAAAGSGDDVNAYRYGRVPRGERGAALRLLASPAMLDVVLAGGRPVRVGPAAGGGCRVVADLRGPYSVSGEWWEGGFDRTYYRVELAGGVRWWIFQEGGRWFLHGELD